MKYIIILFLFVSTSSFGQSTSLTKIINEIEYQNDTIQAVYDWVTENIEYDVKKFKQMKNGVNFFKKGGYKSVDKYRKDQLEKVIKKKKGVCQDYSLLFNSIVSELGYPSYMVSGITKSKEGKVNSSLGHAWNAVKVNGIWKLFDTTWGAGYVKNDKKFVKKPNKIWYDVSSEEMNERHLPHDPMWQLTDSPIDYKEFRRGKTTSAKKNTIDFKASIEAYLKKSKNEKSIDKIARMEMSNSKNAVIRKHLKNLKMSVNNADIPDLIEQSNLSQKTFSEYFRDGRNKRFTGPKWTKEYAKTTLVELRENANQSITSFKGIKTKDSRNKDMIKRIIKGSRDLIRAIDKELKFIASIEDK